MCDDGLVRREGARTRREGWTWMKGEEGGRCLLKEERLLLRENGLQILSQSIILFLLRDQKRVRGGERSEGGVRGVRGVRTSSFSFSFSFSYLSGEE